MAGMSGMAAITWLAAVSYGDKGRRLLPNFEQRRHPQENLLIGLCQIGIVGLFGPDRAGTYLDLSFVVLARNIAPASETPALRLAGFRPAHLPPVFDQPHRFDKGRETL